MASTESLPVTSLKRLLIFRLRLDNTLQLLKVQGVDDFETFNVYGVNVLYNPDSLLNKDFSLQRVTALKIQVTNSYFFSLATIFLYLLYFIKSLNVCKP